MLIDELGRIVDLVVDDDEEVLLGVVLSNVLVGELCDGGHFERLAIFFSATGEMY